MAQKTIDEFRYTEIQHKPIDLNTRLQGITTEFEGLLSLVSQSFVLRFIVVD